MSPSAHATPDWESEAAEEARQEARQVAQQEAMARAEHLGKIATGAPVDIPDCVLLWKVAKLTPKPVRWLWPGWLACGKLHILAGAPGEGKTTIAMALAATVSAGGKWPDGTWAEPGNVLIWSGEDDAEDTLAPRLLAAGADTQRCYIIGGRRVDGDIRSFDPARDIGALQAQALQIGEVRLIIVDPLVSAVAGDSHKNTEVRRALQPMVDLGQRLGAAVLGISHLSKAGGGDGNPLNRVNGSIAFGALARLVLLTGQPRTGPHKGKRLLTRAKSNIGPDGGGFEYQLDQAMPAPGITTNCVTWGQRVDGSARDLLGDSAGGPGGDSHARNAVDEAADFLQDILADGALLVGNVKAQAKDAGLAWITVRRAAEDVVIKQPGADNTWYWKLARLPGDEE